MQLLRLSEGACALENGPKLAKKYMQLDSNPEPLSS